jgi:hypothetical protein
VRDPPQVFLTGVDSNVVGKTFKLTFNVNGCDKVDQAQVYDHDTFIKNLAFTTSPTAFELTGADLGAQYSSWGMAIELLITVKASCDDGRTNKSMPVSGTFFPVDSVYEGPNGGQAVPDTFFAEGGLVGSFPTFVGCIGVTGGGTALLRVGLNKDTGLIESKGANVALPFPCTMNSQFTERNQATGFRWMYERDQGAIAFDQDLNITSVVTGLVKALAVDPNSGDAIIWVDKTGIERVNYDTRAPGAVKVKWGPINPGGAVMGDPALTSDRVRVPVFVDDMGTSSGTVSIHDMNLTTGASLGTPLPLKVVNYGFMNTPEIPPCTFSPGAAIIYFPFTSRTLTGEKNSQVVACSTVAANCDAASGSLKWQSPLLPGQTRAVFLFSTGTQLAAIGDQELYSLSTASGNVTSFDAKAVRPSGSLTVLGFQVGAGTDTYLLNGPPGGYPTEVVSVDSPTNGELYRYQMGGGTSPASALTMSVDDSGQPWLRVGLKLVKPLKLTEYRQARGYNKPAGP